jgi:hypothetical protein
VGYWRDVQKAEAAEARGRRAIGLPGAPAHHRFDRRCHQDGEAQARTEAQTALTALPRERHLWIDCGLFEDARELLPKIVHVVAQLHDRDNLLNLIMDTLPSELLQPLMQLFVQSPYAARQTNVERQNLTMRMSMRRFTRLTNGFSKKAENHMAMISLYFMYYNFARVHQTLRVTPAMEAGIAQHVCQSKKS